MVVAGFAIPSPGLSIAGPDASYGQGRYRLLAHPAAPTLLIVPSIGLKAPVIPIDADANHVLHPPADVHEVGWWRGSAKPGSLHGQTLITGHTVHTGGGVMNQLGDLHPGAMIEVKTALGVLEYKATKVFVYTKPELAKHANELFGQKREHNRLVLVTCTGWTGSEYTSNIIVFAEPLGVLRTSRTPGTTPGKTPAKTPSKSPSRGTDDEKPGHQPVQVEPAA
ncbi:class F sortase [Nocardioides marmorisolisilvae]|uniref:Class F sortase n=2 Tax=Nocardioides marmorisolisilvae TaxID=1542737 RepID=A0A3N0DTD3_9ACTN|nr:class F sortase [Nocardioides marmorisolisilvae]